MDSGYVSQADLTLELVGRALGGRRLDLLLNTHLHSDHCGGNAALQARFPSVRTLIPPGDAALVQAWDVDALSYRATGQQCDQFRFEGLLSPGQDVVLGGAVWQAHSAPGHDPNSVVLFESQSRTLISADALWESGFGVVFPELRGEPSFDQVAATLDFIESLQPSQVIPGHGRVFEDVASALALARRRLEGFARQPLRHARHALKVLLKFKLLETPVMTAELWRCWTRGTPYLETIRARFFVDWELDALCLDVLKDLARTGMASFDDHFISNQDA